MNLSILPCGIVFLSLAIFLPVLAHLPDVQPAPFERLKLLRRMDGKSTPSEDLDQKSQGRPPRYPKDKKPSQDNESRRGNFLPAPPVVDETSQHQAPPPHKAIARFNALIRIQNAGSAAHPKAPQRDDEQTKNRSLARSKSLNTSPESKSLAKEARLRRAQSIDTEPGTLPGLTGASLQSTGSNFAVTYSQTVRNLKGMILELTSMRDKGQLLNARNRIVAKSLIGQIEAMMVQLEKIDRQMKEIRKDLLTNWNAARRKASLSKLQSVSQSKRKGFLGEDNRNWEVRADSPEHLPSLTVSSTTSSSSLEENHARGVLSLMDGHWLRRRSFEDRSSMSSGRPQTRRIDCEDKITLRNVEDRCLLVLQRRSIVGHSRQKPMRPPASGLSDPKPRIDSPRTLTLSMHRQQQQDVKEWEARKNGAVRTFRTWGKRYHYPQSVLRRMGILESAMKATGYDTIEASTAEKSERSHSITSLWRKLSSSSSSS